MPRPLDPALLSGAERDVLTQALDSYARKMSGRRLRAQRDAIRREAFWRARVARRLLSMIE